MAVTIDQARAAKPEVLAHFRKIADVVGIGITRVKGDYAVKVNLSAPPPHDAYVPTEVAGVPVHVAVLGQIRPLLGGG